METVYRRKKELLMAEKLFTQTELNKIVASRIKRERERLSRDFEKS